MMGAKFIERVIQMTTVLRGIKARITIDDASVDAAIDAWFGHRSWRDNADADLMRRVMRRSIEAAIAAAPLEEEPAGKPVQMSNDSAVELGQMLIEATEMGSTMIEKVARAMLAADGQYEFDTIGPYSRIQYFNRARAAIEALNR